MSICGLRHLYYVKHRSNSQNIIFTFLVIQIIEEYWIFRLESCISLKRLISVVKNNPIILQIYRWDTGRKKRICCSNTGFRNLFPNVLGNLSVVVFKSTSQISISNRNRLLPCYLWASFVLNKVHTLLVYFPNIL